MSFGEVEVRDSSMHIPRVGYIRTSELMVC
jgi:hypothetical protein